MLTGNPKKPVAALNGVVTNDPPLIAANAVTLALVGATLFFKLKYK